MAIYCKLAVLVCAIITKIYTTECTFREVEYAYLPAWNDKVCPANDILFSETTRSATECLTHCTRSTHCLGIFFNKATHSCEGCILHSGDTNLLNDKQGTICYTKPLPCGPPPPTTFVAYGEKVLIVPNGYQITYTCYPCTYFLPPGETGFVTCQANGTWTTPVCVNGAEIGFLQNGIAFPAGASGCAAAFNGNTCPNVNNGVSGFPYNQQSSYISTCFCDNVCCGKNDCCYDYGC